MDIPYRTFATRSSRPNERFEQLSRGNVGGTTNGPSSRPPVSSPRKRVNVVNFRSTPSPVPSSDDVDKDVLPPISKQPRSTTPVTVPPPKSLNIPTSVATKYELRGCSENSLAAAPLIAPKFRRRSNQRNGPTQIAPLNSSMANQRPKLPSNQSSKLPPSTTTNQKSEADPYAWVEEEEPEPKPSEFAVREEDEADDGVKPWFWPASREVAKQPTSSNTKGAVKADPKAVNRIESDSGSGGVGDTKPRKLVVPRDHKSLYSVVEKVKDPYECQERGDVQHALDDMNYLIDGLSDTNSTNTRCLSILTLSNKCLTPATRDVIHAYGLLKQICANLHDAHTDYSLGLTAAGLFFVLSRDRDPDLLTSESLAVLLKLLHAPNTIMENATVESSTATGSSKYTIGAASRQTRLNKEASQIRTRVQQLLEAVAAQQQKRSQKQETPVKSPQPVAAGMAALFVRKNPSVASLFSIASGQKLLNARHLRMNRQLTARDMVLEAVLNLSTRKAAPWFKSGIRTGGGLDGVAEATVDAVDYLKDLCTTDDLGKFRSFPTTATKNPTGLDDFSLDNLKRVGYYAKMLENMTYMNPDNQTHLVRYKERALIDRLVQCIHLCASRLPRHPPPSVAWVELQRKESEEKEAKVRSGGEDEKERQQPPTSSTEGEEVNKPVASSASADEYQQDQQTLLTCLLSIFRLFVNVSHSEYASDRLGGCPGLLEATLDCLFHLPDRLPSSRRFDLLILILCLLANLCEHCPENRIRIVHLEVRSSESVAGVYHGVNLDNVGYEDDEGEDAADSSPRPSTTPTIPTVSALDEVVKLFLYREKKTLMHEFERDEEEGDRSERKSEKADEADSTTTTATSTLQRSKPPPSLLANDGAVGETIEEAGLKWRLVGGSRHGGGRGSGCGNPLAGGSRSKFSKRSRLRAKRRRRRLALLSRGANKKTKSDRAASSDEEEEDEEEDDEDDDELCSDDEDGSDGSDEEEEYDEDDELCGGADVEFVAETQEEQEKLKERMSSANQHMEDSVVAAYAALLLGCILQSSPRYAERIRARLPEPGKFRPLAIMLAKLLSFLSLARGVETAGSESILRIVRTLEAQDQPLSSTDLQASTSSNTLQPPTTRSALRARHV